MTNHINTSIFSFKHFTKRQLKVVIFILSCHLLSHHLGAQEITIAFENYGTEEGLSHRQVNSICQDQDGFIWIGTADGLNRFDGYEFDWWTAEKNDLYNNRVDNLEQDAHGYLWLIYNHLHPDRRFHHIQQIDLLTPYTREVISFNDKFGSELPFHLNDVYADFRIKGPDQSIYLGTSDTARLIRYHPKVGFELTPIAGFRSFAPLALTTKGHFWGVSNDHSLIKIDAQGTVLLEVRYQETLHPHQMAFDGRDFWVQLDGGENVSVRFQKIDGETGLIRPYTHEHFHLPNSLANNGYQRIKYDDKHEMIWGTSVYPYAAAFRKGTPTLSENLLLPLTEAIAEEKLGTRSFFVDKDGNVWLGGDYGLSKIRLNKNRFKHYLYTPNPKSPKDRITCRGMLRTGNYLFVSSDDNGPHKIDLQSGKKTLIISLLDRGISGSFSFLKATDEVFWTLQKDIVNINPKTNKYTLIKKKNDIINSQTWALYQDQSQRIWMGTENGLFYINDQENKVHHFTEYGSFSELANARIIDFIEDKGGFVWLCTNIGLYHFDPQQGEIINRFWKEAENKYRLPSNNIHHIYQDKTEIYWLATGGNGLIRWDKKNQEISQFTRADGLANNNIYAVYEDQSEHLWMSSDLGIMQFDKNTYQVQTYLEKDGITHHEFNRTSHYQDSTGRIYFGGLNGVTAFDPKDFYLNQEQQQLPLVITDFEQFDGEQNKLIDRKEELLRDNEIILQANDRFFYLSFVLLNYTHPEQTQYAYKIIGWDDDWQYQRERTLRFGRLPYGRHLLKIKAQGADGQWSANELQIPITVLKPFYLQYWFIGLILTALSLIIGLIYRFYLSRQLEQKEAQQLKEIDQVKTRFYTNITHEFRTPLTVILGMTEEQADVPKAMKLIRRNGKQLLNLINQLLDLSKLDSGSIKPVYDQMEVISFTRYLNESFQSLAEQKNIHLSFHSDTPTLWMDVDEEKYQQIISNLLSNAIKFTKTNGKITLQLSQQADRLHIEINDNGIGVSPDALVSIFDRFYQSNQDSNSNEVPTPINRHSSGGTGIGLAIVKEYVHLMEGQIEVRSQLSKGSTFKIQLPIRQEAKKKDTQLDPLSLDRNIAKTVLSKDLLSPTEDLPQLLIIEDNLDVVIYIQTLLKSRYNIDIAMNGAEGIEKAQKNIPDIIISDVMMPQKTGFEVVEILKQDERTSHIPIILLTAKATQKDKLAGLQYGADAYLMKPFDKTELLVRLEKLLQLRRELQLRYAQTLYTISPLGSLQNQTSVTRPSLDDLFLQKIRGIVEESMGNSELDINFLCKAVHLSSSQLFRKMKALTGEAPMSFIRQVRLNHAKQLLQSTDLSIAEIAYDTGFSDPNYFSRSFSKQFGRSPKNIRKQ